MDPALPAGLALAVVVITLVALVFLDTRAAKKARRTWEGALEARFREHAGHSGRLMLLERVIDAHIAAHDFDVRRTAARPRPTDAQLAAARPYATAAALEVAHLPEPPVDSDGDRGGINPGDPLPESAGDKEAIRARLEAEADAREAARDDRDEPPGDDERTQVHRRPTLLGWLGKPARPDPLAGVPRERPTSSAARTAAAFRERHGSSPTLVSAGMVPPTPPHRAHESTAPGETTPPGAPANDAGVS
jgi:hypothetical protein